MEIEKRGVEPVAGFSREIGFYLSAMEEARAQTRNLVRDLSEEEIARRFLSNVHSIGALVLHLGECEYWWIQAIVAGKEMTEEGKTLSHWMDTLETDFDKGYSAKYCIETIDKISQMTRETLTDFTDKDLEKFHVRDYPAKRVEFSLRSILQRLIDHEAHHRGQIAMIKRLLRDNRN